MHGSKPTAAAPPMSLANLPQLSTTTATTHHHTAAAGGHAHASAPTAGAAAYRSAAPHSPESVATTPPPQSPQSPLTPNSGAHPTSTATAGAPTSMHAFVARSGSAASAGAGGAAAAHHTHATPSATGHPASTLAAVASSSAAVAAMQQYYLAQQQLQQHQQQQQQLLAQQQAAAAVAAAHHAAATGGGGAPAMLKRPSSNDSVRSTGSAMQPPRFDSTGGAEPKEWSDSCKHQFDLVEATYHGTNHHTSSANTSNAAAAAAVIELPHIRDTIHGAVSKLNPKFKKEPNSYKDYIIALPRMANALYFTPACSHVNRYVITFPGKEHMQRTVITYKVVETRDTSADGGGAAAKPKKTSASGAAAAGGSARPKSSKEMGSNERVLFTFDCTRVTRLHSFPTKGNPIRSILFHRAVLLYGGPGSSNPPPATAAGKASAAAAAPTEHGVYIQITPCTSGQPLQVRLGVEKQHLKFSFEPLVNASGTERYYVDVFVQQHTSAAPPANAISPSSASASASASVFPLYSSNVPSYRRTISLIPCQRDNNKHDLLALRLPPFVPLFCQPSDAVPAVPKPGSNAASTSAAAAAVAAPQHIPTLYAAYNPTAASAAVAAAAAAAMYNPLPPDHKQMFASAGGSGSAFTATGNAAGMFATSGVGSSNAYPYATDTMLLPLNPPASDDSLDGTQLRGKHARDPATGAIGSPPLLPVPSAATLQPHTAQWQQQQAAWANAAAAAWSAQQTNPTLSQPNPSKRMRRQPGPSAYDASDPYHAQMQKWDLEIQTKWQQSLPALPTAAGSSTSVAAAAPKKVTESEVDILSKRLEAMSFLDASTNENRNYVSLFLAKACALWTFRDDEKISCPAFVKLMMNEQTRAGKPMMPTSGNSATGGDKLTWHEPWHWGLTKEDWEKMYWLATGGLDGAEPTAPAASSSSSSGAAAAALAATEEPHAPYEFGKYHMAMTLSWLGKPHSVVPPLRTAIEDIVAHLRSHPDHLRSFRGFMSRTQAIRELVVTPVVCRLGEGRKEQVSEGKNASASPFVSSGGSAGGGQWVVYQRNLVETHLVVSPTGQSMVVHSPFYSSDSGTRYVGPQMVKRKPIISVNVNLANATGGGTGPNSAVTGVTPGWLTGDKKSPVSSPVLAPNAFSLYPNSANATASGAATPATAASNTAASAAAAATAAAAAAATIDPRLLYYYQQPFQPLQVPSQQLYYQQPAQTVSSSPQLAATASAAGGNSGFDAFDGDVLFAGSSSSGSGSAAKIEPISPYIGAAAAAAASGSVVPMFKRPSSGSGTSLDGMTSLHGTGSTSDRAPYYLSSSPAATPSPAPRALASASSGASASGSIHKLRPSPPRSSPFTTAASTAHAAHAHPTAAAAASHHHHQPAVAAAAATSLPSLPALPTGGGGNGSGASFDPAPLLADNNLDFDTMAILSGLHGQPSYHTSATAAAAAPATASAAASSTTATAAAAATATPTAYDPFFSVESGLDLLMAASHAAIAARDFQLEQAAAAAKRS